jgi:hypothetical protein
MLALVHIEPSNCVCSVDYNVRSRFSCEYTKLNLKKESFFLAN